MPELNSAYRSRQTSPALLAAAAVSPHTLETLDNDPNSPWKQWGEESTIITENQRELAIEAAEKLFYSSPLAHYIIEQYTDFVVGEGGFELTSSNRNALRVLYDFWHSPVNSFPRNVYNQVQEYFVYGELCYVKKDHPDGFVSVTFVPPREIVSVSQKDGIPGRPDTVTLANEQEFKVIDWDPVQNALVGECFYFRMQHLGSDVRGYSRLFPLIDFLRAWESFTYNYLGKRANWDAIWWRVILQGYTQEQIDNWLKSAKSNPPEPGSVLATNELVDWELLQPDFRAGGLDADATWYQNFLEKMGGLGGEGSKRRQVGNVGEVLDPTTRGLSTRQWEVRTCYAYMGSYVLQQAIAAKKLRDDTYDVACQAPRLGVRDFQRSAASLLRFIEAIGQAEDREYITPEMAAHIFKDMLSRLGMVEKLLPMQVHGEEEEKDEDDGFGDLSFAFDDEGEDDTGEVTGEKEKNGEGNEDNEEVPGARDKARKA